MKVKTTLETRDETRPPINNHILSCPFDSVSKSSSSSSNFFPNARETKTHPERPWAGGGTVGEIFSSVVEKGRGKERRRISGRTRNRWIEGGGRGSGDGGGARVGEEMRRDTLLSNGIKKGQEESLE